MLMKRAMFTNMTVNSAQEINLRSLIESISRTIKNVFGSLLPSHSGSHGFFGSGSLGGFGGAGGFGGGGSAGFGW